MWARQASTDLGIWTIWEKAYAQVSVPILHLMVKLQGGAIKWMTWDGSPNRLHNCIQTRASGEVHQKSTKVWAGLCSWRSKHDPFKPLLGDEHSGISTCDVNFVASNTFESLGKSWKDEIRCFSWSTKVYINPQRWASHASNSVLLRVCVCISIYIYIHTCIFVNVRRPPHNA